MSLLILLFYVLYITSTFQANGTLLFRQMTSFRQIATTPPVELCGILKDDSKVGSVWRLFITRILKNLSMTELTCPLKRCKLYNLTIEHPVHVLWPSGEYKHVIHLSNNDDQKMFQFSFNVIIKSIAADNF